MSSGCFRTDECRPHPRAQRRRDTEHRLTHNIDVWVASASADGAPYLVPLSFDWDGETLLVTALGLAVRWDPPGPGSWSV